MFGASGANVPGASDGSEQIAGKLRGRVMQPVVGPRTTGLQTFFRPT
jgi:hypothetical protein